MALDLTLRDLQSSLKDSSQPWEKAKAFDGSCPLSSFVPAERISISDPFEFSLIKNGNLVQEANSEKMIFPLEKLLLSILDYFSLMPGDVVLTGTPAGVGTLNDGDHLQVSLLDEWTLSTQVERA